MKILFVSMPSLHFFRWAEQLKGSGHEVFWFDITGDGGRVERLGWAHQKVSWKSRFIIPGKYFFKSTLPKTYRYFRKATDRKTEAIFEEYLKEVEPDVVHSFALYVSCAPILNTMRNNKNISWIYSSWGSDLYYFRNFPKYMREIEKVLPRVNYFFSDCQRDVHLAKKMGFDGEVLGVFPGGGGFDFSPKSALPFFERKQILIKGYEGRSGRASTILQALSFISEKVRDFPIVVFGIDKQLIPELERLKKLLPNLSYCGKVDQKVVGELMGQSFLYVGNSLSDGIPNTLLEAIYQGCFPLQSNPGGATAEIIQNGKNGLLINNPENPLEIAALFEYAIENLPTLSEGVRYNDEVLKPTLEREAIKHKVLAKYSYIGKKIRNRV